MVIGALCLEQQGKVIVTRRLAQGGVQSVRLRELLLAHHLGRVGKV
jgi:hypothetical protein